MPKSIHVDPAATRAAAQLNFPDVPLHAYAAPFSEERAARGDAALVEVLRHMMVLRAFESGIASLKSTGKFGDLEYAYKGPAHLSIGQEGAAVGAALALTPDDHVYGSHRSHSEFLAKGLRAIADMTEADLQAVMEAHEGGALLRTVEAHLSGAGMQETAEHFLLLGFLAEIFMRSNGFNGGMGGSMHAFFLHFCARGGSMI